jgi:TrmH family RNA methyltransferase
MALELTLRLAGPDHERMPRRPRITSRQNARVKDAARLRIGRERRKQRRFLVDGAREILRAVEAGVHFVEAFVCEELCDSAEGQSALEALRAQRTEILSVSPDVYAKLAFGAREDGMVVVAETPRRSLADLKLPAYPLVAVLEGIEKPGNLGAILRSADAAGVDSVIASDCSTDLYNPNTIRASLGTVFRANVCETTTADALAWLRQQGLSIVAARPDAEIIYTQIDMRGGVAIVLGSEAKGLSDEWRDEKLTAVRLPMGGLADSLNVSTTAAVLFYEALRQRSTV